MQKPAATRTAQSPLYALLIAALFAVVLPFIASVDQADAQVSVLKDHARPGLLVGGVLHGYNTVSVPEERRYRWDEGDYANVAGREFSAVTATAYMAYGPWSNPNNPIDTSGLDAIVDWAQEPAHRMPVHGHVLLYPLANKDLTWWNDLPRGSGEHERLAREYIETMAGHRAGEMWVWDVVNEVFDDDGNDVDEDGLRTEYLEYQEIGSDYVEKAFRWAAAADPNALLIINDYGIAAVNQKSTNLLNYMKKLRDDGVPIDGVGFQMHQLDPGNTPDYQSIRNNFARFAAEGFKLFITELDVMAKATVSDAPPSATQVARQKEIYRELTKIAVEQPAVESLLLWDFADGRSWIHPTDRQLGDIPPGRYSFPAPWSGGAGSEALVRKPAYDGIVEGLVAAVDEPDPTASPYRLTAAWEPATANLTRSGDLFPGDGIDLAIQGVRGDQWTIEAAPDAGTGWFRLRNTWGADDGYLTRRGVPDGAGGYTPTGNLDLHPLQVTWTSQLWRFEPIGDGQYRIRNGWEPESGVLMRNGVQNASGGWDPGSTVSLYPQVDAWTSQRWAAQPVVPAIDCPVGEAQAESGRLTGAMQRYGDATAGGSASVDAAVGTRNNYAAPNAANAVEVCARVESAGRYRVDARVIAPDSGSDSFWVSVDGGEPALWHIPRTTNWTTRRVVDASTGAAFTVDLTPGQHDIRFFHRETGARLDSVTLVRVGGSEPECSAGSAEAESGAAFGTMQVSGDGTASGGQRAGVPASERNSYVLDEANRLEVCVTVPSAGQYAISARTIAPDGRNDSFWIGANDAEPTVWHVPQSTTWANRRAPGTFSLRAGDNTITIYARESTSKPEA